MVAAHPTGRPLVHPPSAPGRLRYVFCATNVSYEEYHPYGTTAWWTDPGSTVSQKRYRYTGKEKDEESGLYYQRARYYAPWLARWSAADPAGLADGPNRFAYCSGRPVHMRDPSGRGGTGVSWEEENTSETGFGGGSASGSPVGSSWDNGTGAALSPAGQAFVQAQTAPQTYRMGGRDLTSDEATQIAQSVEHVASDLDLPILADVFYQEYTGRDVWFADPSTEHFQKIPKNGGDLAVTGDYGWITFEWPFGGFRGTAVTPLLLSHAEGVRGAVMLHEVPHLSQQVVTTRMEAIAYGVEAALLRELRGQPGAAERYTEIMGDKSTVSNYTENIAERNDGLGVHTQPILHASYSFTTLLLGRIRGVQVDASVEGGPAVPALPAHITPEKAKELLATFLTNTPSQWGPEVKPLWDTYYSLYDPKGKFLNPSMSDGH